MMRRAIALLAGLAIFSTAAQADETGSTDGAPKAFDFSGGAAPARDPVPFDSAV